MQRCVNRIIVKLTVKYLLLYNSTLSILTMKTMHVFPFKLQPLFRTFAFLYIFYSYDICCRCVFQLNFTDNLTMSRSASLACLELCMSLSWAAFVSLQ